MMTLRTYILIFSVTAAMILMPAPVSAGLIDYPTNNLGMIGYWTFDGADMIPNVRDRASTNHGNLAGQAATTTVVGKIGQAILFDGSNDRINLGRISATEGASQLTWSFWAYTKRITNGNTFLSKMDAFSSGIWHLAMSTGCNTGNQFIVHIAVSDGDAGTFGCADDGSVVLNQWKHYVVVFDGTQTGNANRLKIYVDGVQDASLDFAGTIPAATLTSADNVHIAANSLGTEDNANVIVDDLRIYARAISDAEARQLYNIGGFNRANSSLGSNFNAAAGYWTFDGSDLASNVRNRASSLHHGQLVIGSLGNTATTTVSGKLGQALDFDGQDDYINIPDPNMVEDISAMTVSAWVKGGTISNAGSIKGIVTQSKGTNDPFGLLFFSDNKIAFEVNTGSAVRADADSVLADLNWHHYVGVYNGSNALLYIDGILQSDQPAQSGNIIPSSNPITIGGYDAGTFFQGSIDDVRIYSRALSLTEVRQLLNSGKAVVGVTGGDTTGLLAHWTFDGKDMYQNVSDKSGSGYNGFIIGQTSTTTAFGAVGQAILFDGINDGIQINPATQTSLGNASWSFWIKPDNTNSTIVNFYGSYVNDQSDGTATTYIQTGEPFCGGSNDIRIVVQGNPVCSDANILSAGTWTHVVIVYNGSGANNQAKIDIYANGELVADADGGGTIPASFNVINTNHQIGSFNNSYFAGSIDDFRIYGKSLTAAEARRLYSLGR